MKSRYRVEYVTVKDNLWAWQHETIIDAENMNQLISEMDKTVKGTWYLLRVWERREGGVYVLCNTQGGWHG